MIYRINCVKKRIKYWLIVVFVVLFSCNSNEDEYNIIYDNTSIKENNIVYESGRLIPVNDLSVDVAVPMLIGLLDDSVDAQRWLNMEAETYCESYDLLYLRPEYSSFPNGLIKDYIKYKDNDGNLHKLDLSGIVDSYSNGFFLIKPDTVPVFMPWDTSSIHFDAPAAEVYYRFTFDDNKNNEHEYSAQDYVRMFPEIKLTINEKYNYKDITTKMNSRNFDLQLETGLSNRAIVEAFYIFKYLVEEGNTKMIAHNVISYPLKLTSPDATTLIKTPKDFINEYNNIITPDLKQTIHQSTVFNLNPDKAGFMLNDGDVYFKNQKQDIRITVIRKK